MSSDHILQKLLFKKTFDKGDYVIFGIACCGALIFVAVVVVIFVIFGLKHDDKKNDTKSSTGEDLSNSSQDKEKLKE